MHKQAVVWRYLPGVLIVTGIIAAFVLLHLNFPLVIGIAVIAGLVALVIVGGLAWNVLEKRLHAGKGIVHA
ncbi:MAG: hypothetical protein ACRDHZ_24630 [Ktedonobacteraceae bacterium]